MVNLGISISPNQSCYKSTTASCYRSAREERGKFLEMETKVRPWCVCVCVEYQASAFVVGDFLNAVTMCPMIGKHGLSFRLLNEFHFYLMSPTFETMNKQAPYKPPGQTLLVWFDLISFFLLCCHTESSLLTLCK